jgi:hypothetical protein
MCNRHRRQFAGFFKDFLKSAQIVDFKGKFHLTLLKMGCWRGIIGWCPEKRL